MHKSNLPSAGSLAGLVLFVSLLPVGAKADPTECEFMGINTAFDTPYLDRTHMTSHDGSWSPSPMGAVSFQNNKLTNHIDASSLASGNETQAVYWNYNYTTSVWDMEWRKWNGSSWGSAEIVNAGGLNSSARISTSFADTSTLHICTLNTSLNPMHAVRTSGGSYSGWGHVEGTAAGTIADLADVACAGIGQELHYVVVTTAGAIHRTIRAANGSWSAWENLEDSNKGGEVGTFISVDVASEGTNLHIVGLTSSGDSVWHAMKSSTTWYGFGSIEGQSGSINTASFIRAGDCFGHIYVGSGMSASMTENKYTWRNSSSGSWKSAWGTTPAASQGTYTWNDFTIERRN